MSTGDDRAAFEAKKRQQAAALGADADLFARTVETIKALDKYDYSYLWSWLGVPIIQMPADIVATQEAVWNCKPDVIVETGVARGGSMIFLASLLELIGKGKVIGVDVDIRAHNRETIESHPLSRRISLIEGASTDAATLDRVKAEIPAGASVMAVLDSDHSREHVLAELRAYGPLVTEGCYMVVADTVIAHWEEGDARPGRAQRLSRGNEPLAALDAYLAETDRFAPDPFINAKLVLSSSPGGYLRCLRAADE